MQAQVPMGLVTKKKKNHKNENFKDSSNFSFNLFPPFKPPILTNYKTSGKCVGNENIE